MDKNFEFNADNYEMIFDIHTHTTYSHGKGSVEENVKCAIDKGLEQIAISDHGPGHVFYGIKRGEFANMRADIEECRKKYPEIKISISVEANNVLSGNGLDVTEEEAKDFDFIIAGFHFGIPHCNSVRNWLWSHGVKLGEESLRRINTKMIIDSIRNNDIAVLTHPGDKGPFDIDAIAQACEETGTIMEINNRHGHLDVEEIKIAAAHESVKFIVSSDAHVPEHVGNFSVGLKRAMEAGLDLERIVNIRKKQG